MGSNFEFYPNLSEEQIDIKIEKLTSTQRKIFDADQKRGNDRRTSLLIAESYPIDV
jgi:hypothetical protein